MGFWDAENGKNLLMHRAGNILIFCGAFSADSKLLATGCHDGRVRVWSVPELLKAVKN